MDSTLVIKVKYGDTIRRFSVFLPRGSLNFDMNGLRTKIITLFKFAPDADLTITYVDEDSDVVTLVDDDDLRDVIKQRLNPLRVNVVLNSEKAGESETRSVNSATPRTSENESRSLSINSLAEVVRSVPDPLREALTKVIHDCASKAASSAPALSVPEPLHEIISKFSLELASKTALPSLIADLLESTSKLALTEFGLVSQGSDGSTVNTQNNHLDSSTDQRVCEGLKASKDSFPIEEAVSNASLSNLTERVETSVPPTTARGFNVDLNEVSESVFSALNDSDFSPLACSGEKGKTVQKERVRNYSESAFSALNNSDFPPLACGGEKGKTVQKEHVRNYSESAFSALNDSDFPPLAGEKGTTVQKQRVRKYGQPCAAEPVAPVYPYGGFGATVVDNSKKHHGSASGSMPQNNSPVDVPSDGFFRMHPVRTNYIHSNDNSMGRIFHKGVRCDGCGVHPITGPRFKSKVKIDYDLCSICFSEMGNEIEYTRIDRPRPYLSPRVLKEDPRFGTSSMPHLFRQCPMRPSEPKFDSCFIKDVNIVDGTQMAPSTSFTKIWRMRNTGNITWPLGTQLLWIGGDQISKSLFSEVMVPHDGCFVGNDIDIAVDFVAPVEPGEYKSFWRMALPTGKMFGQCIWVIIEVRVGTPQHVASSESCRSFNLNLPAQFAEGPLIDMNTEFIDVNHTKLHDVGVEMVDGKPSEEQNIDLTISDGVSDNNVGSILVVNDMEPINNSNVVPVLDGGIAGSNGDSVPLSQEVPGAVSYPVIGFPVAPSVPSQMPAFCEDLDAGNLVEQTLLKELDEMGFKQTDLNKEILRMHDYDLEQSLDDLCGGWDPMLEELDEMGFPDKEANKKLLIKNGGSIKRVVMDLIAGENA